MVRATEYESYYRWCFGIDYKDFIDGQIPDAVLVVFWNKGHGDKLFIRDINHFHNREYEIEDIWRRETNTPVKKYGGHAYSYALTILRNRPREIKNGKTERTVRRRRRVLK